MRSTLTARTRFTRRARVAALVSGALVAAGLTLPAPAASGATPTAPVILSPQQDDNVSGMPTVTWARVRGAKDYDAQLSKTDDFASPFFKVTTVNDSATPTAQLPADDDDVFWLRVRVNTKSGAQSDWNTISFNRSALAGPDLLSPVDGGTLAQPDDPILFKWTPLAGMDHYEIEVDDSTDFITPFATGKSDVASVLVNVPAVANTYYWRVRGVLATGVYTEFSGYYSYDLQPLPKPVLTSPADSPSTTVDDVVLDWEPVPGASTYDLQISTDQNFLTVDKSVNGIESTRYSPPATLNNDQYYWRVRPVDTLGNKVDWGSVDIWQFRRAWSDQPQPVYPINDAVVDEPIYFEWTPTHLASSYQLQISTDPTFSSNVATCSTVNTTFVPATDTDCMPGEVTRYYWRVIAHDLLTDAVTDSVVAPVASFFYVSSRATQLTPANTSTVDVPTFTWSPVAGAAKYKLYYTNTSGGATTSVTTSATSYTPLTALPAGTYRWDVQTISHSGHLGTVLAAEAQPTFTVTSPPVGVASQPDPVGPSDASSFYRFPSLSWTPVAGAAYYKISWRDASGIAPFVELPDKHVYPAGTDTGTDFLVPGTYQWQVKAYDSGNSLLGTGTSSTFVIAQLPAVSGNRATLVGTGMDNPSAYCDVVLPDTCVDMRATPVLRWDSVGDAGYFMMYVGRDKEMTNLVSGYPKTMDSLAFMSTSAFPDSQAGSAYFWTVSSCTDAGHCAPMSHAGNSFNKLSNQVALVSPAEAESVANDVTFNWADYLDTNTSGAPGTVDAYGVPAGVEARNYRIEISKYPNFQTNLVSAIVDQTTFTPYAKSLPEGTLYWRLTPYDGTGNPLATSEARSFVKASPQVTLLSPLNGDSFYQDEPFFWQALAFADHYDIEVYKNDDTTGSTGNRVFSKTSKQVAYVPTTLLTPSDTAYRWRVRPVDASGNKGPWTDLADDQYRFFVVAIAPDLAAPADHSIVGGNDALFTWVGAPGAAKYTFERWRVGGSGAAETVTTANTAYAPTKLIADGDWKWRVRSKDSQGHVLSTTGWWHFTVDSVRPTVVQKSPTRQAKRTATFKVVFSEKVADVSSTGFKIFKVGSVTPLSATVQLSADGLSATLKPTNRLRVGSYYLLKIGRPIKDLAGNALVPTKWKVKAVL